MPLNDVLARIPGFAGWEAVKQNNAQSDANQIQQYGQLQQILSRRQAMQQEQEIRGVLAQAGGDPAKAVQALLSNGSPKAVEMAAHLKGMIPKPAEPYTLAPGAQRRDANNALLAEAPMRPDREQPQSNLARLRAEKAALPPGDPGHKEYADAIIKESQTARQIAPPPHQAPIVNTADGIFERRTGGLVPLVNPATGAPLRSPSIAGGGEFSPEALRMTAEQYLTGDRQAIQGYARNAPARIALQNEIAKLAKEKGWKGDDIAAQMADFAGIMSGSRTVGVRAAQIELASSEADKMIDIVLERSKAFERTQFVPINVALRAFQTQTGEPEVKAFGAAINSLVNVYARAISPSGVPTVSDKEHAREILAQADSPAQVQAVMDVMRQEMKAARAAPSDVRTATRAAVTGATPNAPTAPVAVPGAIREFATEAEAAAAGLKAGDRVKIGGKTGTWR